MADIIMVLAPDDSRPDMGKDLTNIAGWNLAGLRHGLNTSMRPIGRDPTWCVLVAQGTRQYVARISRGGGYVPDPVAQDQAAMRRTIA